MGNVFLLREDEEFISLLNETHDEVLAMLKHRNPKAKEIIEDDEACQIYALLTLLRAGKIKVGWNKNEPGETKRMIRLELEE